MAEISYNVLCRQCERVFQHATKHVTLLVPAFHTNHSLVESARSGCHFCNILLYRLGGHSQLDSRRERTSGGESGGIELNTRRKCYYAELRYFENIGLSFILRDGSVASLPVLMFIELRFGEYGSMSSLHSTDLGNPKTWSCVADWIDECAKTHEICGHTSHQQKSVYPTRIIDVGGVDQSLAIVCETRELSMPVVYVTLSHRWGLSMPKKLQMNNYDEYTRGIPIHNLSKTFGEAIEVTRRLHLRYIWIDSLCIIQDSIADWENESAKMSSIYSNGYLNIAASGSSDANGGLFRERPLLSLTPCTMRIGGSDELATTEYTNHVLNIERSILSERGWVFQERMLSPRVLHFSVSEIFWECKMRHASELFPKGFSEETIEIVGQAKQDVRLRRDWTTSDGSGYAALWKLWSSIVARYSETVTTKSVDKLVAVAGLAASLQDVWQSHLIRYVAGLWTIFLRKGLLWHTFKHHQRPVVRRAPSWSWASVDGSVIVYRGHLQPNDGLVKIIEAETQTPTETPTLDEIESGLVRLRGPLKRFIIHRDRSILGEKFEIQLHGSTNDTPLDDISTKVRSDIYFDDPQMEIIDTARIYMMPFEVQERSIGSRLELVLRGLALTRNWEKDGSFNRIGYFEIFDVLENELKDGASRNRLESPEFPPIQYRSDLAISESEISRKTGGQSLNWEEILEICLTANELRWWQAQNKDSDSDSVVEMASEDFDHGERSITAEDPFKNGETIENLFAPFEGTLSQDQYPQIHGFLLMIGIAGEAKRLAEVDYEHDDGGGFYTISIT